MVELRKFTPEGVDDINYINYEKKDYMQSIIKHVFKTYGYKQISTPTFEFYDLFKDIDTAIDKDQMYKIIDANGKILVLRPDATIPIARMIALGDSQDDNKFMYFTNVFRSEDFRAGGKREFVQAGIEFLGNQGVEADSEVVAAALEALTATGFGNIRVDLGNINYFNGIVKEMNLDSWKIKELKNIIENKNLAELELFLEKIEITAKVKKVLLELPFLYGKFDETVEKARALALNQEMIDATDNICEIKDLLKYFGYEQCIYADMGFVNHLDYYSGMIFKVYLGNIGAVVASGGRYDGLIEKFGRKMPATGFGLNIDAMYEAVMKEELLTEYTDLADFAIYCSKKSIGAGIGKANELRKQGYSVLFYVDAKTKTKKAREEVSIGD